MANNFSTDSSCKALWRFESGALTTDSIGPNTLTPVGSPTANTSIYKEGAASIQLNGSSQYAYITDASMVTNGVPLNHSDSVKQATICCWMYSAGNFGFYTRPWDKTNG